MSYIAEIEEEHIQNCTTDSKDRDLKQHNLFTRLLQS